MGYQYRVFDDTQDEPYMPASEKKKNAQLMHLKLSGMKLRDGGVLSSFGAPLASRTASTSGPIAVTSDLMANRTAGAPLTDSAMYRRAPMPAIIAAVPSAPAAKNRNRTLLSAISSS